MVLTARQCWIKQAMAKFATVAKQMSSEQSRLSSDEKHLLRDEKLVKEERKELEVSISEQTAYLEKQRDSARYVLSFHVHRAPTRVRSPGAGYRYIQSQLVDY